MIQANELRIGNWIYVPVKDSMQDGTWKDGVNQVEVTSIDEFGELGTTAYFHMSMGCTGTTCKDAIPIELSPEILTEWCGFRKDATFKNPYHSPGGKLKVFFQDEQYPLVKFKNGQRVVRFLHELQNLAYALTGKELEIKIPELKP